MHCLHFSVRPVNAVKRNNRVCCANHMKNINMLSGRNAEFCYVKARGIYSNHCVSNTQYENTSRGIKSFDQAGLKTLALKYQPHRAVRLSIIRDKVLGTRDCRFESWSLTVSSEGSLSTPMHSDLRFVLLARRGITPALGVPLGSHLKLMRTSWPS
jgi:hypothetical protein